VSKCVRCAREFSVLSKPEPFDMCFPCREESKDQATEDREFAFFANLQAKCAHLDYRWLDCEDCRDDGETCQEIVCVECGASKED
jgi:hypothetical protein